MTKRNQEIDVDAGAEFEAYQAAEAFEPPPYVMGRIDDARQRLEASSIITVTKNGLIWREGHIEHVARIYASDRRLALRDYADDLTIAESLDGDKFAALVEQARGEAE